MTAGMLVKVKIGSTAKGSCGEKWRLRALPWYNGEWKQGAASPGRESLGKFPKSPGLYSHLWSFQSRRKYGGLWPQAAGV